MTTSIAGSSATTPPVRWWLGVGVVFVTTGLSAVAAVWSDETVGQLVVAGWLVTTAAVAAVLVARVPRNAVGWLLAVVATCVSLQSAALAVAGVVGRGGLFDVAAWLSHWIAVPGFGAFAFLTLLFPTGRLPSPRWRWVAWSLAVGLTALCVSLAFAPARVGGVDVANPFAWDDGAGFLQALATAASAVLVVGVGGTLASLALRYRRSDGDERQQVKWFLFAVAVLVVTLLFAGVASGPVNELSFVLALVGLTAVPVAIGVAIQGYRRARHERLTTRACSLCV